MSNKFNVHIIDQNKTDSSSTRTILLENGFFVSVTHSTTECLEHLKNSHRQYDVLLIDQHIFVQDDNTVLTQLSAILKPMPPILAITDSREQAVLMKLFAEGVDDVIQKPFFESVLITRIRTYAKLFHASSLLKAHDIQINKKKWTPKNKASELEETQKEMIYVLTDLMEASPQENSITMQNMAKVASLLATLHPELTTEDAHTLLLATPMHDVGTITLPPELIYKQGKFSAEEFEQMKAHTTRGYNLLKRSSKPLMQAAATIAHEHQEKWDGSGYPRGLRGTDINIYGRIVAVADVFDAMIRKNSYNKATSCDEALAYIKGATTTHFDPQVVELFTENYEQFKAIYNT